MPGPDPGARQLRALRGRLPPLHRPAQGLRPRGGAVFHRRGLRGRDRLPPPLRRAGAGGLRAEGAHPPGAGLYRERRRFLQQAAGQDGGGAGKAGQGPHPVPPGDRGKDVAPARGRALFRGAGKPRAAGADRRHHPRPAGPHGAQPGQSPAGQARGADLELCQRPGPGGAGSGGPSQQGLRQFHHPAGGHHPARSGAQGAAFTVRDRGGAA